MKAARDAGELVPDGLGNLVAEEEEDEQSENDAALELDTAKVVADLKLAGKIGGQNASKEEVDGARETFKKACKCAHALACLGACQHMHAGMQPPPVRRSAAAAAAAASDACPVMMCCA